MCLSVTVGKTLSHENTVVRVDPGLKYQQQQQQQQQQPQQQKPPGVSSSASSPRLVSLPGSPYASFRYLLLFRSLLG
ncbi:unnamed protein product [Gongylonema pulchrum]|uniref:Uncharacterized protein n=1 Tax=Gongylonema pulchrum TaxID=637853 RepID=A0A183CVL5_9BILA|nr:unnamed protein product [Gongylonema pulchrum]